MMQETIGKRIAKYRKAKGMTQEELASQLGVSSQAVSKWENDQSCPDIQLLPQLCGILNITSDELLSGKTSDVKLIPATERKSLDELTLRVYVSSKDGDRIKVNLPMSLVKVCMEIGMEVINLGGGSLEGIEWGKILELAERGVIGKIVEMESADGDIVEVVVE